MKHNLGPDNPRITQAKAQVRQSHEHICWYMYKNKSKYTIGEFFSSWKGGGFVELVADKVICHHIFFFT